ncbi:hypothetical protein K474DRAFT_819630 [Panus rudis PR-1116 ss-1]|nr:hypothetical protein K474DRAFT_819630 [Panus rudis PR-1116 ss-1]
MKQAFLAVSTRVFAASYASRLAWRVNVKFNPARKMQYLFLDTEVYSSYFGYPSISAQRGRNTQIVLGRRIYAWRRTPPFVCIPSEGLTYYDEKRRGEEYHYTALLQTCGKPQRQRDLISRGGVTKVRINRNG